MNAEAAPNPLAIAVGDPAGVGPEVSLCAAAELCARAPVVLFGDAAQLRALAQRHGVAAPLEVDDAAAVTLPEGRLGVVDTGRVPPHVITLHAPSEEGGRAQLHTLERAARFVQAGHGRALVTGPTSKAAIVRTGQRFIGQTEHLAAMAGLADDAVTMMFLGPTLRVALVTTHLAISEAPRAITYARVTRTVRHMGEVLLRLRHRARELVVAGLNPHAGEEGLFGREEIEVIGPALRALESEEPFASGRIVLTGPSPAEAVFRAAQRGDIAGVVAMIHDQATIASKLLDWGAAVNTTWGLPFVRTSVDHGVAYDAAARGTAEADGMRAALAMALELTAGDHGSHAA